MLDSDASYRTVARYGHGLMAVGHWTTNHLRQLAAVWDTRTDGITAGQRPFVSYGRPGSTNQEPTIMAVNGNHYPNVEVPDGSFSAWGAGGHFIAVIPAMRLVIVPPVCVLAVENDTAMPSGRPGDRSPEFAIELSLDGDQCDGADTLRVGAFRH